MKKIYIVTQFSSDFEGKGNNRFNYLAGLLVKNGYEVEMITSDFSHVKKRKRTVDADTLPFRVTLLPEPGYPKNVCLKRFRSHRAFGKNLKKYLFSCDKPDLIYAATPSLDVGAAVADYCTKTGVPLIADIQDLWPEAFKLVLHVPLISDLIFAPMTRKANKLYAAADRIVAVSRTYRDRGVKSGKKDKEGLCVYLGTDLANFDANAASFAVDKPEGELWIAYVGTLGHSYNIEIIIDALNRVGDRLPEGVVFKVLGDGPYLERFKEYAKDCKVRVDFLGRLPYPEMTAYLTRADVAVNPIVKGAAQSIINKHADYAAAGLPVVNTQECPEYRDLMTEYDCGINCDVEDAGAVGAALQVLITVPERRREMGANSRRMAEELFDRPYTYQKILAEIEKLTQ